MATVRQREDTKFYFACFRGADGKRKQISTHLTDRNAALQVALKMENAAGMAREKTLTRDIALRIVNEMAAFGDVALIDPTTTQDFLQKFFDVHSKTVSVGTARRYAAFCKDFLAFMGDAAAWPLVAVTPAVVAEWRNTRLSDGLSPKSVQGSMSALEMAFKEAVDQQRIEKNPFDGIKKPAVKKLLKKKAFSWDQFDALVKATDGEWRLCILIGGYTGQRQQDIAQLKWDQVNWRQQLIVFRRRKTQDELQVPMHPTLESAMASAWLVAGQPPKGFILPDIAKLPATTMGGFPAVFRRDILPKIGISQPYADRKGSRGRTVSEYSFHSLRHMLSTALNSAGVSAETRMLVVGHADRRVSANYTHAQLSDAAAAVEKLPGLSVAS